MRKKKVLELRQLLKRLDLVAIPPNVLKNSGLGGGHGKYWWRRIKKMYNDGLITLEVQSIV